MKTKPLGDALKLTTDESGFVFIFQTAYDKESTMPTYPTTGYTPSQSEQAARNWRGATDGYFKFRQSRLIQTEAEADKLHEIIAPLATEPADALPRRDRDDPAEWLGEPQDIGEAVQVVTGTSNLDPRTDALKDIDQWQDEVNATRESDRP